MRKVYIQRIEHVPLLVLIILFIFLNSNAQRRPEYILEQNLGACLNPLGMLLETRISYRIPLSQDTGILFKTARFEVGLINEWSPGDEMIGVGFNYEPLAVFNIRVNGGFYDIYKTFGFGYRILPEKTSSYHDTVLADLKQHTRTGFRLTVAPSLKMKLSKVILANNFTFHRIDIFNEQDYYYEIRSALPHAVHDWNIINDVLMLYEMNDNVLIGGNHNLVFVNGTEIRQQKLGAMAVYSASGKKVHSFFGLLTCGVYLESALRKHSLYIAALTGFEMPLLLR